MSKTKEALEEEIRELKEINARLFEGSRYFSDLSNKQWKRIQEQEEELATIRNKFQRLTNTMISWLGLTEDELEVGI